MNSGVPSPCILHDAGAWLALDKPAGWHSVMQGSAEDPSVEAWLRGVDSGAAVLPEAGLCHRLDRGTSGCLVAAREAACHGRLREAFGSAGSIRKSYLAVAARGLPREGHFRLNFESRYKRSAKVTVREAGDAWSAGRCRWRVRGPAREPGHELVEVELVGPGRRHQIRAGLAHLGSPLLGDTLYGGREGGHGFGAMLHAWRLELEGMVVEAPRPAGFGA
ncbi:MAG: hypothetical protein RLZZ558_1524 [Planctomycetota bacterium]